LLLLHDAKFPSATACIAGAIVRGSWWGHPQGKLIYETLTRMTDDVAWAKLVLGKETLVHRRLWSALVATAEARQAWQLRGLPNDARQLLQRVRKGRPVTVEARGAGASRKLAAVANDLERRLLARSYTEHTPAGHHARFLETWAAWARRNRIAAAELPAAADAIQALSAPVMAWAPERRPPGLLPWLAAR
jgi:antitoxin (DNA-binding transcriptional repressor) of toxin-antitoxin stability system